MAISQPEHHPAIMDTQPQPSEACKEMGSNILVKPSSGSVCCPCGALDYEEADIAMIFCDACGTWQHTVCCGYYSNSDKRISHDEGSTHTCYACQYKTKPKLLKFCSDLSLIRRALFLAFNFCTFEQTELAKGLGTTAHKTTNILKKLTGEGFLVKVPLNGFANKFSYECVKSNEVKKKIKHYFSLDLEIFPEYQKALGKPASGVTSPSCPKRPLLLEHNQTTIKQNGDKNQPIELPSLKKKRQSSSTKQPIKCFLKDQ